MFQIIMNVHRKERLCCNWNKIKYNWICHYQTVYSNYRCVSVINTILMRLKIEIEFENILLSVLIISNDYHCTLSHHEIILIALQFFLFNLPITVSRLEYWIEFTWNWQLLQGSAIQNERLFRESLLHAAQGPVVF